MGMAAGQARLLSITSRMSDNELRAQIINNNKMRLATESSQASEAYVAALNEAQLMFTNYDINNNTTYQNLTYNALTAFNPYNNQYALINSSGNVLLSEKDAENYRASGGNLDVFLSKYGLDYTTTYFDQLSETVAFYDSSGGFTGLNVDRETLKYLYSGNAPKDYTKNIGKLGSVNFNPDGINALSYMGIVNSSAMYDYEKYLQQYTEKRDNYQGLVAQAMKEEFKNLVKNRDFKNSSGGDLESISDIGTYLKDVIELGSNSNPADDVPTSTIRTNIMSQLTALINSMSDSKYTNSAASSVNYLNSLKNFINDNAGLMMKETFKSNPGDNDVQACYVTDGSGGLYIAEKNGDEYESILFKVESNGQLKKYNGSTDSFSVNVGGTSAGSSSTAGWTTNPYKSGFVATGSPINIEIGNRDIEATETTPADTSKRTKDFYEVVIGGSTPEVNFSLYAANNSANMANVAKLVLTTLDANLDRAWNLQAPAWTTAAASNSILNNAYIEYLTAAKNLSTTIFGSDQPSKYDAMGDIYTLYNTYGDQFCDEFKKVFLSIIMDEVLDTYGEPNYTWIDLSSQPDSNASYNTNGTAKAAWYENLFKRIQAGGYQVLQDGLASSPEWIQFAFESGIVTMEQIDTLGNWQSLIYTNCSDITSQTNEKMIAKAEAEYRNAMNKIENKDKRYDLELKNIDTEHNSLMTEYESIKTAIDKNIERTFKLYS